MSHPEHSICLDSTTSAVTTAEHHQSWGYHHPLDVLRVDQQRALVEITPSHNVETGKGQEARGSAPVGGNMEHTCPRDHHHDHRICRLLVESSFIAENIRYPLCLFGGKRQFTKTPRLTLHNKHWYCRIFHHTKLVSVLWDMNHNGWHLIQDPHTEQRGHDPEPVSVAEALSYRASSGNKLM